MHAFRYHEQAAKDAETVYNHVQQLLQNINLPDDTISEQDVKTFCKHASEICVIRGTRIADEYERKGSTENDICEFNVYSNLNQINQNSNKSSNLTLLK